MSAAQSADAKSAGLAYVLWFFLGFLGIHRLYLGRIGSDVTMLILTLLAGFISLIPLLGWMVAGFLFPAVGVWWIVDAFLIPGIARGATPVAGAQATEAGDANPDAKTKRKKSFVERMAELGD